MRTRQRIRAAVRVQPVVFFRGVVASYLRYFTIEKYSHRLLDNPSVVLSLLLAGSAAFMKIIVFLLLVSYGMLGNRHVIGRVVIALVLLCWVYFASWRLRKGSATVSGLMLLALYFFIATTTVILWSITVPFGLLMFGFVIVLSGIILGSRYSLVSAATSLLTLGIVQLATNAEILIPDRTSVMLPPNLLDVAGFGTMFMVLALASWISGHRMDRSLERALTAEHQLLLEKDLLATRLEERTQKLQAAQLKEMQQLYRFAELGQLSTALLHDLANHLTVLTLDIEDIHKKQHSRALLRAKNSIHYLDNLVEQVRDQLRGDMHVRPLNVIVKIRQTTRQLRDNARKQGVVFKVEYSGNKNRYMCFGDPTRFRQVLTILISNAIDAYSKMDRAQPLVVKIEAEIGTSSIIVRITDWGSGISPEHSQKLFKPFHSTKSGGMGIGLFIARQMITMHFKGSVDLEATQGRTTFVVNVPLRKVTPRLSHE